MRHLVVPLFLLLVAGTARAQQSPDTTHGETLRIVPSPSLPRDVSDDATRLLNAPGTLRLTQSLEITADRVVESDVAILDGTLAVSGRITGRVVAINADVILRPGARIEGSMLVIGGRLEGGDPSTIAGESHVYADRVSVMRETEGRADNEDERWWRRRQRWSARTWSHLRLISARTYDRVEGLPVYLGPSFGHDVGWGRVTMDVFGIIRSVGSFEQTSDNLGHNVKIELRSGQGLGLRVGGRLYDVVDPVEAWHLSDPEVGLASFLMRRDFRDYYDKHGGTLFGGVYLGNATDLTVNYSDQRWASRATKEPLSLFRNNATWRPNPSMDEGTMHLVNSVLRYDTRNDSDNPWSGWFLTAEYEFGRGTISRYGATSPGVRAPTAGGRTEYDRLFLDLRRYNRVSPDGQLNVRLALGGWLGGDPLPLQRRLSVGGPGTLPGYDFRRPRGSTDVYQCATASGNGAPSGDPAQCDRVALAQVEYRGAFRFDPFGLFTEERRQRRRGWGRTTEWVVFMDAGRGWLVGDRQGRLRYPSDIIPPFGTFRTDLGVGFRLDDLGLYIAKAVSDHGAPLNFFVRLKPRF